MKAIFLALFVVAVSAVPLPEDRGSDAVKMTVNGVPEGAAMDDNDSLDIQVTRGHAHGAVVANDLKRPYTAFGIPETGASVSNGASVVYIDMARVHPMPIVVPSPPSSGVDTPVELRRVPIPEIGIPEAVALPSPAVPKEVVVPEQLPVAAPQYRDPNNDGLVQVQYNGPESPGMLATLQSWFNMIMNYFNPPQPATAPGLINPNQF